MRQQNSMDDPRMPNFFLIGAPRSGTTTIYYTLQGHPDIEMSPHKEPLYMAIRGRKDPFKGPGDGQGITDLEEYLGLFKGAGGAPIRGEASTLYLASADAARGIRELAPEAKIVAVLREPVARAYSHYQYHVREGRETAADFEEALRAEPQRLAAGWSPHWGYARTGFYHRHLSEYFDRFPRDQLRVYTFDDLVSDFEGTVRDLWEFLGVDPSAARVRNAQYNPSGSERVRRASRWMRRSRPLGGLLEHVLTRRARQRIDAWRQRLYARSIRRDTGPGVPTSVRAQMEAEYRRDHQALESLIGRDLSMWRSSRG